MSSLKSAVQPSYATRLRNFLRTRNLAALLRDEPCSISRVYVYAFLDPQKEAYSRVRLGDRQFEVLAGWLGTQPWRLRGDYIARGGQVVKFTRRVA